MFDKIYEIYENEVTKIPFACSKGCSTCCTQSVTMTSAEGKVIMAFLAAQDRELPALPDTAERPLPGITINTFAACCLDGREVPDELEEPWIYEQCVFLEDDNCAIYPARPFACRSFSSTQCCGEHGIAEAPDWFITMNTVVNQLVEHLDRGGCWGNMIDVINFLANGEGALPSKCGGGKNRLQLTRPLPGFLIPPDEEAIIRPFWEKVEGTGVLGGK